MGQESQSTEGRALLTDTERAALAGERSDSYRYKTRSYLKRRIEKLEQDAEVLAEHAPDLLADIQTAVDVGDTHPPQEPRETVDRTPEPEGDQSPTDTPATPRAGEDALGDVVDVVATSWDDTPERIEARKDAARAVLEYAREHGSVSKKEAKEQVEPNHPVEGQNPRTWYRKNIRPVLNEAAEYDQSKRGYELTVGGTGGNQ